MSFRIDLTSIAGVNLSLTIVNDQININYELNDLANKYVAFDLREQLNVSIREFRLSHKSQMVRGEDPEHIKRHHYIAEETKIIHSHISFDQEVSPEILDNFCQNLFRIGLIKSEVAETIVKAFTEFSKEFAGSSLQQQCMEARQLTRKELDSLLKHAKRDSEMHFLTRDERISMITSGIHPCEIFSPNDRVAVNNLIGNGVRLNGRTGKIESYDAEKGRFLVRLSIQFGDPVKVNGKNAIIEAERGEHCIVNITEPSGRITQKAVRSELLKYQVLVKPDNLELMAPQSEADEMCRIS